MQYVLSRKIGTGLPIGSRLEKPSGATSTGMPAPGAFWK